MHLRDTFASGRLREPKGREPDLQSAQRQLDRATVQAAACARKKQRESLPRGGSSDGKVERRALSADREISRPITADCLPIPGNIFI